MPDDIEPCLRPLLCHDSQLEYLCARSRWLDDLYDRAGERHNPDKPLFRQRSGNRDQLRGCGHERIRYELRFSGHGRHADNPWGGKRVVCSGGIRLWWRSVPRGSVPILPWMPDQRWAVSDRRSQYRYAVPNNSGATLSMTVAEVSVSHRRRRTAHIENGRANGNE